MSLGAPKVKPQAAPAPVASQGADALKVGGDSAMGRTRGAIGRLALRVRGNPQG